ncbi:NADP-dependent phosphogluconate dehydrogenase [Parasediminibacterium sp. JCM 36343]|uniref:NADP-dependent phosphogluconate dehydrogenase n=1 Tax=Parasediminibacterium sp. JCM 36343 TaxID=3374279 RepID=UPI00397D88BD
MAQQFDFAMIGLGVMGRNLLLNMADHGFAVVGFDKDATKTNALEGGATPGTIVKGVNTLEEMVSLLSKPRKIIMLVPAGKPVDDVLQSLQPLLEKDDVIIDGGNSHYTDTARRIESEKSFGFHFMGMGISGGEEGARRGPSIMPGGDAGAYKNIQPVLEAIAAKDGTEPCVAYMGKGAAGHYVKMVHNGIEYAIMQILGEVYDILKRGKGFTNPQLHEIFDGWNKGDLKSYLIEITAAIFLQKDEDSDADLVDKILDVAGSKGTGKWTSQSAMDLGTAIPVIDAAVSMRSISGLKKDRVKAAGLYTLPSHEIATDVETVKQQMHDALFSAIVICYAQGLAMLQKASVELDMQIPLQDAVKVWRQGCIIRSAMLGIFYNVCNANPGISNILLDEAIAAMINEKVKGLRSIVGAATEAGIPSMALSNALNYFDAFTSEKLPLNLTQAQRDFFGAHTYQRIDKEGIFHSHWNAAE